MQLILNDGNRDTSLESVPDGRYFIAQSLGGDCVAGCLMYRIGNQLIVLEGNNTITLRPIKDIKISDIKAVNVRDVLIYEAHF